VVIADAEFRECTFTGVAFSGLEVRRCRFVECRFIRCDLSVMKPIDSGFAGCSFEDGRLTGIDWRAGRWPKDPMHESNRFERCDLGLSDFSDLNLPGLVVTECRAREVNFRNAKLGGADFSGTDCTGTDFAGADLSGARLVGAAAVHLDPRVTRLTGAVLDADGARRLLAVLGIEIE
jgi:uncharacterized protein YjbI with pentapeptide repeats